MSILELSGIHKSFEPGRRVLAANGLMASTNALPASISTPAWA